MLADIPLTDEQPLQVVAMPATKDGQRPAVGVGYRLSWLFPAAVATAVVGLALVLLVLLGGRAGSRQRPATVPASPDRSDGDPREQQAAQPWLGRAAGIVAVVSLTGCAVVPHAAEHTDRRVDPLPATRAGEVMRDYSERNDAALRASKKGDGRAWVTADVGPLLLVDELVALKVKHGLNKDRTPWSGEHAAQGVAAPAQSQYPLWAIVHGDETWTAKGEKMRTSKNAWVMVRTRAADPWRKFAGVDLTDDGLPGLLPAHEAVPDEADEDRAAEVVGQLEAWVETGSRDDLEVPDQLRRERADLLEPEKYMRSTAIFARPWAQSGPAAPGGATRVVRVQDGLLVHTVQAWTLRNDLKPGWKYSFKEGYEKIYKRSFSEGHSEKNAVGSLLVHVPARGKPHLLGMGVGEILEPPTG